MVVRPCPRKREAMYGGVLWWFRDPAHMRIKALYRVMCLGISIWGYDMYYLRFIPSLVREEVFIKASRA